MSKKRIIKKKPSGKTLEGRQAEIGHVSLKNSSGSGEAHQKTPQSKTQENSPKKSGQGPAEGDAQRGGAVSHALKEKQKSEACSLDLKELSAIHKKLQQALNDNLYLRAEFENFKRRSAEEKRELARYSGERLLLSLANEVLDDLDRAMASAQEKPSFEGLKQGLEMIQKKLSQVFHNLGVEVLDPTGQAFDPSYQEALSHIPTSQFPEGYVAETFKKAYKLHDKVIRPAQVILAKKEDGR